MCCFQALNLLQMHHNLIESPGLDMHMGVRHTGKYHINRTYGITNFHSCLTHIERCITLVNNDGSFSRMSGMPIMAYLTQVSVIFVMINWLSSCIYFLCYWFSYNKCCWLASCIINSNPFIFYIGVANMLENVWYEVSPMIYSIVSVYVFVFGENRMAIFFSLLLFIVTLLIVVMRIQYRSTPKVPVIRKNRQKIRV